MKFLEARARNFLVFENDEQVLPLDSQGLVLLEGNNTDANGFQSNGAGKSSLISIIPYALYGILPDGKGGDSVVNNKTKKNMKVSLKFQINNDVYLIERYRKDKENKNKVLLYRNDKEITQSSVKKTNQYIQDLVHMSMDTFLNSIMFGLGNKIKFTEATDKEKKQLLEDVANISIYKRAYELSKDDLKEAESKQSELALKKSSLEQNISNYKQMEEQNKVVIAQYKQTLVDRQSRLDSLKKELSELTTYYDTNELQSKKATLQTTIDSLTKSLNSVVQSTTNYSGELSKVNYQLTDIKTKGKAEKDNKEEVGKSILQLSQSKEPVCQYCGNILDKNHLKNEIKRLGVQYNQAKTNIQSLAEQYNFLVESKNKLEPLVEQEQQTKQKYSELDSQRQSCQTELAKIKDTETRLELLRSNYESAEAENNSTLSKPVIVDNTDKLKTAQKDLEKIEKEYTEVTSTIDSLSKVVKVYSDKGVISHVLDLVMPYINQQANYYLSELTDNTISVKINPQTEAKNGNVSEKLNIEVTNINGGDEYNLNSKGERKRIDLSISLALQDYVMSKSVTKTNLIGYDEVFDGLDDIGIQRVMYILKQRVNDISTVLVISHNDKLKELFEKTIKITKTKGVSHIEKI